MAYPPLVLWTIACLCTMVLCWGGIALLLHPNVVSLSAQRQNPISVIELKQPYVPPPRPSQMPQQPVSQDFSIVPILGLALLCIMGSHLIMGRMRSYH